jgi:hypothetical protein
MDAIDFERTADGRERRGLTGDGDMMRPVALRLAAEHLDGARVMGYEHDLGEARDLLVVGELLGPVYTVAAGCRRNIWGVSIGGYAATDSRSSRRGLWRRASRAGTRTSAVITHEISPVSEAWPKLRTARFSLN